MIDQEYREFIFVFLTNLEPRYEIKGYYLANELDEFGEVTFVQNGKIGIGFEINKIRSI